jgi:proteasome lid subunit RPN8/RPN11
MFTLDDDIKAKILQCIDICCNPEEKEHEHEQCGIIVGGNAIALANKHSDPCNHFHLSPQDLYPYQDNIQAIFHTHCRENHDGYLSYDDIRTSQVSRLPVVMYHTLFESWDFYNPQDPNPFPLIYPDFDYKDIQSYIGIHSHWGRSDCFAIARSFYLGMFGVDIGEFPRCDVDTFPLDDYVCPWAGIDFPQIAKHEEMRVYDAIAIATRGGLNPNHVAILLPDNMILHSPLLGGMSKVESYGNFWRKRTIYIKRIIDNAANYN